jgi:hypothetical protein
MSSDFWAGYVSGAIGIVIGNPLDVIKVRLQARSDIHLDGVSPVAGLRSHFESVSSLVRGSYNYVQVIVFPCTLSDFGLQVLPLLYLVMEH